MFLPEPNLFPAGTGQDKSDTIKSLGATQITLFSVILFLFTMKSPRFQLWNWKYKEWVGVSHSLLLFYSKQWFCLWELNAAALRTGHCRTNSNQILLYICNVLAFNVLMSVPDCHWLTKHFHLLLFPHWQFLFAAKRAGSWSHHE